MGAVEIVALRNSGDEVMEVYSVSSDSVHFHARLNASTLEPGQLLNVSVVFLPRTLSYVANTIVLQTSLGGFLYSVTGTGIPSRYGLQPFLGAKTLVGVPYTPALVLYNPHETVLQGFDMV
jgi:hypothetical protein